MYPKSNPIVPFWIVYKAVPISIGDDTETQTALYKQSYT